MDIFVARQPIFDRNQTVIAYELLFRSNSDSTAFDGDNGDHATSSVLSHSFTSIGLETLTGGKPAFINFTKNLLLSEVATAFPCELVAVEILENVEPEEEVIEACKSLKAKGYTVVLDDFVLEEKFKPLVELADIIKIDFRSTSGSARAEVLKRASENSIKYLAEKVETREEFAEAVEIGYTYFQGYFFCKPEVISGRTVPGHKQTYLRLLAELADKNIGFARLEKIFKQDISLSYKLLSYINSPFYSFPKEIKSIRHALALLGLNEVKRWLCVVALGNSVGNKGAELIFISLVRGVFCEGLAPMLHMQKRQGDLFLLGFFSAIDAILEMTIEDILTDLPLQTDLKEALSGDLTGLGEVLKMTMALERADWQKCAELAHNLEIDYSKLSDIYLKAFREAHRILEGSV